MLKTDHICSQIGRRKKYYFCLISHFLRNFIYSPKIKFWHCPGSQSFILILQGHPYHFVFLIWLKMTHKCIVNMKERHFYNHKDSPFDMKHQLMSAGHEVSKLIFIIFPLLEQMIYHWKAGT